MTLGEAIIINQIERQPGNGFFEFGEAPPVEKNELYYAIERAIQNRRFALESLAMWQRLGEKDSKKGDQERAEMDLRNAQHDAARIAEIEIEIASLCSQVVAQAMMVAAEKLRDAA